MEELFKIITDMLIAFNETVLPKDTALAFANIIGAASENIVPLIYEYIAVLFG